MVTVYMSYEQFIELVNELKLDVYDEQRLASRTDSFFYRGKKERTYGDKLYLFHEWTSGGMSGRGYWGGELEAVEGDPEPGWTELDDLLAKVAPKITYLEYKKIDRMVTTGSYNDGGDYYGNYYTKSYKHIDLRELYDYLKEINYV